MIMIIHLISIILAKAMHLIFVLILAEVIILKLSYYIYIKTQDLLSA